jgi:ABC-2 type transport system ATP-binding protein
MSILKVEKINKTYEKFQLKDVSFSLEKGYIMGFIGENGAGKTTTLKAILNMIHIESGKINVFDLDSRKEEQQIKQEIGYMFGGVDFYPRKKLKQITDVVKRFYRNWDEKVYRHYIEKFRLDEEKKVHELSNGMKVKYNLALALSHDAKFFILDEPTSGLDPAARDSLLEIFQEIIEDGERSILFSTHIVSDLEKCADYITYINNGRIIDSSTKENFTGTYRLVRGSKKQLESVRDELISFKENSFGFTGLIKTGNLHLIEDIETGAVGLEDIMIYYAKRGEKK